MKDANDAKVVGNVNGENGKPKTTLMNRLRKDKRKKPRLSVDEIVNTLVEMQGNLNDHAQERNGQVSRLEEEKKQIEQEIAFATSEKERGEKIRENISKLLEV